MENLSTWKSFGDNCPWYIKVIEQLKQQQCALSAGSSVSGSASTSTSSAASSTASSPTAVAKEAAAHSTTAARAAATATALGGTAEYFKDSMVDTTIALIWGPKEIQHRLATASLQQLQQQQQHEYLQYYQLQQLQQQHQQQQQLPPRAAHQQLAAGAGGDAANSNMANSFLWQPWRDLQQAAAIHRQLYTEQQQQQQQLILHKGSCDRGENSMKIVMKTRADLQQHLPKT